MVYLTDGSSHHNGVANEHTTVDFINRRSVAIRAALVPAGHTLVQVGGTKTKIDARVVKPDGNCANEITISIKNHKGSNGTFDWTNTTDHTEEVKEALKEFRKAGVPNHHVFNSIFATHLKNTDDRTIRSLLQKCATKNPEWLVVNNRPTNKYVLARTPDLTPLADWNYFLKFGRGVTSGQIWRRRGTEEVNTDLRLRLVSNNGLGALFGPKGSVPCFKIQQERVKDFIASLPGAVQETAT
jgi:hypothetical protein